MPVLLTRPEPQGSRFARMLLEEFGGSLRPVSSPLLAPVFLQPDLPAGPVRGLVFTSETGVHAFQRISADPCFADIRQVWCVGDRTASVARAAGLPARSAAGDAEALLLAILTAAEPGPLLHLRGREVRGDLARRLNAAGIQTFEAIVYAQEPQPFTAEAEALLTGPAPVLLPLFSPRSGQVLLAALRRIGAGAPLWLAALSPAVAASVASLGASRQVIAPQPDAAGMLAAIKALIAAAPRA